MDFPAYKAEEELLNEDQSGENNTDGDSDIDELDSEYCIEEEEEEMIYKSYNHNSQLQQRTSVDRYVCDACEREFNTYWQHQKHMSEHKTCNVDGCTFTAHEKIISKHIRMQHCSGLYDKIRNIETPEDIEKWIAERKKRYPNKENVEKRYKQQEEMLKRGERLKRDSSRFDKKNKTRFALVKSNKDRQHVEQSKKKSAKRKYPLKKNKSVSLINDKSDWNGTLFPFKGTYQLYNEKTIDTNIDNIIDDDDDEWIQTSGSSILEIIPEKSIGKETQKDEKINDPVVGALGALMSAYNSDDSEVEDQPSEDVNKKNTNEEIALVEQDIIENDDSKNTSDDEAPAEQKIDRLEVPFLREEEKQIVEEKPAQSNELSSIKHGQKRKRTRRKDVANNRGRKNEGSRNSRNLTNAQGGNASGSIYKKRRTTLLERLLSNEIVHERNVLLQCIRYIVENNFFDEKGQKEK